MGVDDSPTDVHQHYLLELVFNAMVTLLVNKGPNPIIMTQVLVVGLNEIVSSDNVEKLKRDLRVSLLTFGSISHCFLAHLLASLTELLPSH